ncbi:MAG TPA: ATP-grasp domain-containing protein [Candidatus Dormibacteraeota bacterium]|nr:ATP-grasp domain-containing protein [Candidatus Dormibacteraeota bacterium]
MSSTALPDFLMNIAATAEMRGFVLWPVQDDALELVAVNRERLSSAFRLVTPSWNILRHAHDKRLLNAAADEVGVWHPRTWYPADEREVHTLQLEFPAIIKPTVSVDMQLAIGRKALQVRDLNQLIQGYRLAAAIMPADHIMVQEIIPGEHHYSFGAFTAEGHVTSAITARRTRQYPIDYGLSSSFVEAVEIPGLAEPAARILRRLGLSGMVEVEFILDERDSRLKLLDVNPRPWGWHTLCIACGLDFPHLQYESALGHPATHPKPRYGPRWIRLLTDIPAGLQGIRRGKFSLVAYLRSLFGGELVGSVCDLDDPVPAAGDLAVAVVRVIKGRIRGRRSLRAPAEPGGTRQAL